MSEFKAGDLALIVGSRHKVSPNIGKSVELVKVIKNGEEFDCPDGKSRRSGVGFDAWLVEGEGLISHSIAHGWRYAGGIALIEERYLMPLRGEFQPEQQKSKEEEPCH
jgi:hypothetical protein